MFSPFDNKLIDANDHKYKNQHPFFDAIHELNKKNDQQSQNILLHLNLNYHYSLLLHKPLLVVVIHLISLFLQYLCMNDIITIF